VKFLRSVKAFDVIDVAGAVRALERDGSATMVDLDLWIRGADGALVTVAWARCELGAGDD
jgi:hypothetical protein